MIFQSSSLSELKREEKRIYCFGAGRILVSFFDEFSNIGLESHIAAIADNNPMVVNMSRKMVNDKYVPIISLGQMINEITNDDIILITTSAYKEIVEQLDKIKKLNAIRYYVYLFVKIEQYDYDRLRIPIPQCLFTYEEVQIPKVIHYCWFGKKEIPVQYQEWMKSWRKFCPDYEIIEWNEDNYDVHKNKFVSQAYDLKKWAFVSDYARIDIINEYGGVYLDTDVELVKNIDELLKNEAFCGFQNNKYVAYGLGFGAKKHNIMLQEMKAYYDNKMFILSDGTLDQTPCIVMQTEVMKKHGLKCNGMFQIVDGMAVYPSRILSGMSPHSFRIGSDLTYTYGIHHYAGSWVDENPWRDKVISNIKRGSNSIEYRCPDF